MNHANRGKAWEQTLEMYHARYEAQGRAVVIRTPPPMRILRSIKPGQFVAVYESAGPPDYMALSEGTAFLLEAMVLFGIGGLTDSNPGSAQRLEQPAFNEPISWLLADPSREMGGCRRR